ncbi:MAG: hypothetical protein CR972_03415 [Candidatus Moraniibacteriota bacterium]|nr:MAG: hypothetical protein CR972_03415 [Candidatus Moranbacteria bacterium]
MSKVIIVTGAPGTGKTFFVNRISTEFSLPVFAKDTIKEVLFETIDMTDRAFGKKLGAASFELMYVIVEQLMCSGMTCVLEGNFDSQFASPILNQLSKKYTCNFLQFNFFADVDETVKRVKDRWESGERHKGHMDFKNYELVKRYGGKIKPVHIKGELVEVDTTDFTIVNYDELTDKIKQFLEKK